MRGGAEGLAPAMSQGRFEMVQVLLRQPEGRQQRRKIQAEKEELAALRASAKNYGGSKDSGNHKGGGKKGKGSRTHYVTVGTI